MKVHHDALFYAAKSVTLHTTNTCYSMIAIADMRGTKVPSTVECHIRSSTGR